MDGGVEEQAGRDKQRGGTSSGTGQTACGYCRDRTRDGTRWAGSGGRGRGGTSGKRSGAADVRGGAGLCSDGLGLTGREKRQAEMSDKAEQAAGRNEG